MGTVPEIAEAMEKVLTTTAAALARPTGFVKRESKLTGPVFAKATVLGWLQNPDSSLSALTQVAAGLGVEIRVQGLDQRFGPEAADFLKQLLEAAVSEAIAAEPAAIPILQRFSAVVLDDSTLVALPDVLATLWQGTGERTGHNQAALKLQVRLDLLNGSLTGPLLQAGRTQDRSSPFQTTLPPSGALRLADLGYFSLDVLAAEHAAGVYWLTRLQVQTAVFDAKGRRWEVGRLLAVQKTDDVDLPVTLGVNHRVPARLLAARVPPAVAEERRRKLKAEARHKGQMVSEARLALADWTILVTNAPIEKLSLAEALVLTRARWQIELLFKLWKQHGQIDNSRSDKPWRKLCELYAKLFGMVIQHWLLLVGCWEHPDRSLVKAAATVRSNVALIIAALHGRLALELALEQIKATIALGCRMNTRRKAPNAYQLQLDLTPAA